MLDHIVQIVFSAERWPFMAVASVLTILGQFFAVKVFTRRRAYDSGKWQSFWWWGRETLSLHPIITGMVIGMLWVNPEGADPEWTRTASAFYFAWAGVVSLGVFSVLKSVLKSRKMSLTLPGFDPDKK